MAQKSPIQWTDFTWNPTRGCSRVSPGCGGPNHQGGCYAEKIAARFSGPGQPYEGLAERGSHGGRWTGKMQLVADQLTAPFHWRVPSKVFVNSMSDLFHENLPEMDIAEVFGVMAVAGQPFQGKGDGYRIGPSWTDSQGKEHPTKWPKLKHGPHIFQILTKRSGRMREVVNSSAFRQKVGAAAYRFAHDRVCAGGLASAIENGSGWPLPNVWLGVSVEDQQRADERIPDLLATPAAVRFLSCEPLLGPVDLTCVTQVVAPGFFGDCLQWHHRGKSHQDEGLIYPTVNWVICGGESGPRARPMHPEWARSLRDQCAAAAVPYFFKQWGEWAPGENSDFAQTRTERVATWANGAWMFGQQTPAQGAETHRDDEPDLFRFGKSRAGRHLDGRTHDEFPEVA